jgi:hypothetical protein
MSLPHYMGDVSHDIQQYQVASEMHGNAGSNFPHIADDIRHGTHIAYLGGVDNPIGRILLKPMHEMSEVGNPTNNHIVLRPETSDYGDGPEAFGMTVRKWAEDKFPMKPKTAYMLPKKLYEDGMKSVGYENSHETRKHFIDQAAAVEPVIKGGDFIQNNLKIHSAIQAHRMLSHVMSDDNIENDNARKIFDRWHDTTKRYARSKTTADENGIIQRHFGHQTAEGSEMSKMPALTGWRVAELFTKGKLDKAAHDSVVDELVNGVGEWKIDGNPKSSHIEEYLDAIKGSPHMTSEHIQKLYDTHKNSAPTKYGSYPLETILEPSHNVPESILIDAVAHPKYGVASAALKHPNATDAVIELGMKHTDSHVRWVAEFTHDANKREKAIELALGRGQQ